ncbi:MAG: LruC domain-containing protein [Spirochaetes bacterium]|nr:LruC domain-containing protein [Spirochaetota bacterium]
MKKISLLLLIVFTSLLFSCDEDDDKALWWGRKANTTAPADVVNDEADTEEFRYQTVHDVTFDLQIYDAENKALSQAVIRVTTEQGDITTAVTTDNGTASFKISIGIAIETVSLIIEHPACVTKTVEIESIQSVSVVNRTIFLELKDEAESKTDRDGDGVPDDADEFPDDPFLIGSVIGEYTVAYEDLWPNKGDADFNDLVVRLNIQEFIDNNNMVSKIIITSRLLAAGAGYKNQLWIGILDKDYQLIFNPKQDLNGKWNTRPKDTYVEGPVHTLEVVLDPPVARDLMDSMPYDPYIKCNGNDKNQVHLSFVKTKFKDKVLDSDNFPWAVLVPADWAWPYEGESIFSAYPEFKPWYESKGAAYRDWYLHPEVDKVYKMSAGTALTAYLMKVSTSLNTGIVLAILTVMLLVIVGINFWRRRQPGSQSH